MTGRRCTAVKSGGGRCGARPLRDGELCFHHDPEHAAEAAEARKLGGHDRRREGTLNAAYELGEIDTVDGQRRLLEIVISTQVRRWSVRLIVMVSFICGD